MPSDRSSTVPSLAHTHYATSVRRRAPRRRPPQTRLARRMRDRPTSSRPLRLDRGVAPPVVRVVVVAIPARNEAAYMGACLASVDRAARRCDVPVVVVVAADGCRDDTAAIARATLMGHATLLVVEGQWHSAGGARAAAVDAALGRLAKHELASVWIANTDADCVVPAHWLRQHLRAANDGVDAVAGVVTLDPTATPELLLARFAATYECRGSTHRHVHGANLGLRADSYRLVGGWSTHTVIGEDHDLWRRLTRADLRRRQPTELTVTTSSRTTGRVAGGFASRLSRLRRQQAYRAMPAS